MGLIGPPRPTVKSHLVFSVQKNIPIAVSVYKKQYWFCDIWPLYLLLTALLTSVAGAELLLLKK